MLTALFMDFVVIPLVEIWEVIVPYTGIVVVVSLGILSAIAEVIIRI